MYLSKAQYGLFCAESDVISQSVKSVIQSLSFIKFDF